MTKQIETYVTKEGVIKESKVNKEICLALLQLSLGREGNMDYVKKVFGEKYDNNT
jgi:hypothetical protein